MTQSKQIAAAVATLDKQFGKGTLQALTAGTVEAVPVLSTGIAELDEVLGVGGLPCGRVIEVFGAEGAGHVELLAGVIATAQREGRVCAFIDAEHDFNVTFARTRGVSLDDLLVSQPDCGEQALEVVDTLVRTGAVDLIVIDSVGALTPRAEVDGEGDGQMMLQARIISQKMRKITAVTSRTQCVVVFVNRLRSGPRGIGATALKFYASVRLELRGRTETPGGSHVTARVVKNKLAPPFREATFEMPRGVQ
jgi:recombination protein RecA